nr:MAG TPA: hypothetical protein [Caudoviricetes sp.]
MLSYFVIIVNMFLLTLLECCVTLFSKGGLI